MLLPVCRVPTLEGLGKSGLQLSRGSIAKGFRVCFRGALRYRPCVRPLGSDRQSHDDRRAAAPYDHHSPLQDRLTIARDILEKHSKNGEGHLERDVLTTSKSQFKEEKGRTGTKVDPEERAKAYVFQLLSRGSYTAKQVKEKLRKRGYPDDLVGRVVARAQELELQSDEDYASGYVRYHWQRSAKAPKRLRFELRSKGISEELVGETLEAFFGPHPLLQPRPGNELFEHLIEAACVVAARSQGVKMETRRRRLTAWLQSQGHSWDTISKVLCEVLTRRQHQQELDDDL